MVTIKDYIPLGKFSVSDAVRGGRHTSEPTTCGILVNVNHQTVIQIHPCTAIFSLSNTASINTEDRHLDV